MNHLHKDHTISVLDTYRTLKMQQRDKLLLMRVGDFYEAFYKDADKLAEVCELTVAHLKNKERTPIAGFPYGLAERMILRLLDDGVTVVVADPVPGREAKIIPADQIERIVTDSSLVNETDS